jgi:hypothetical protein
MASRKTIVGTLVAFMIAPQCDKVVNSRILRVHHPAISACDAPW